MDPASILGFIVLFALSAFFSGSETAFMSLPQHKVDSFLKQRKRGSATLARIKKRNERLLITLLIGNNLVNVITASFATKISIDIAAAAGYDQSLVIGISTGIITLLLLLFGEIFPKTMATYYGDKISLYTAKFYELLGWVLFPIVALIEMLVKKFKKHDENEQITDEDVEAFLAMSHEAGTFATEKYKTIKNTLAFYETTAEEIMIPRTKIEAIADTATVKETIERFGDFSHSRIPVYKENIDTVDSFVTIKDLMTWHQQGYDETQLGDLSLRSIHKIPLTQPIHKILAQFKKNRKQLAIVSDEYGGTAGLLTVEDIVEEVFGEIRDETDQEKEPIQKQGEYFIVQADTRIDDVLNHLEIDPSTIAISEHDVTIDELLGETVSYCVTTLLERFPHVDDRVRLFVFDVEGGSDYIKEALVFTVLSVEGNVLGELKVHIQQEHS